VVFNPEHSNNIQHEFSTHQQDALHAQQTPWSSNWCFMVARD